MLRPYAAYVGLSWVCVQLSKVNLCFAFVVVYSFFPLRYFSGVMPSIERNMRVKWLA